MPIPLIPFAAAWIAGGTAVSHAAGGYIVTGAGGYVAGTYLSGAALSTLAAASTAIAGTCAAVAGAVVNGIGATSAAAATAASGVSATVASAASTAGVTSATVAKGALVSAGLVPAVPVWVPIAVTGVTLGCGYAGYRILKQRGYFEKATESEEVLFV